MSKILVESLVEKLVAEDKNILILDTCCVLDVIRCIQRENLSVLKTTVEIINVFDEKKNKFQIVLPSLIDTEWSDNYASVRGETKSYIEKCDIAHKNLIESCKIVFPTALESMSFSHYNLESILSDFSEKLLYLSLRLESIEECKLNAFNRVVQHIPPAAQGKDSTKDCVIFEETLCISKLLRDNGFTKKIVFATSNTREYFRNHNTIPEIANELKKSNIEIVTSLSHGYYLSQKD